MLYLWIYEIFKFYFNINVVNWKFFKFDLYIRLNGLEDI